MTFTIVPTHGYPNEVFIVFSALAVVMCVIPFSWHMNAWNTGTCLYMFWAGMGAFVFFVNSVVWNGNAVNWAPIWCDISGKIIVCMSVAIPASALCITRRLYHIAAIRTVTITRAEKRRGVMIDLAIGVGIPLVFMIMHVINQGHRFNIYEDVGCFPYIYQTPMAVATMQIWPIIIGLISATYAVACIRSFARSRAQFNDVLSSSGHSNINGGRYIRLMCLAGVDVLCTVPLSTWVMYRGITSPGARPWISWEDTHRGFHRVDQFPAIIWKSNDYAYMTIEINRWITLGCAFIFFAFFGFADEARKHYSSFARTISKRVGLSTDTATGSSFGGSGSKGTKFNPNLSASGGVFVSSRNVKKRDSLDSFSDLSASFADVGGAMEKDEKSSNPEMSFGGLVLSDVGGALADVKALPYNASPSSGSSVSVDDAPKQPEVAVVHDIEISSVRRLSVPIPDYIHRTSTEAESPNLKTNDHIV